MRIPHRILVLIVAGLASASASPVHETLWSFGLAPRSPGSGRLAYAPDGYFWGTSQTGGAFFAGTIYKVKADGSDWRTVFSFGQSGPGGQGKFPNAGLLLDDLGQLWGTTERGGTADRGTVFKVNVRTGVLTTVIEFEGSSGKRGAYPLSRLVDDGSGYFWGTTSAGGQNGFGTIYKVRSSSGELTTLVDFSSNGPGNRGRSPVAELFPDGTGRFWGSTANGGNQDLGSIFTINATSGAFTTVMEFTGASGPNKGSRPIGGLVADRGGFLWGTTSAGGSPGHGTIFKIKAATGVLSTVVEFTSSGGPNRGAGPEATLANDFLGSLWGTTTSGGTNGLGTLFRLDSSVNLLTTYIDFAGNAASNKGARPLGEMLADASGNFWGTTSAGGASSQGTVYRFHVKSRQLETLVDFNGLGAGNLGRFPTSGLVNDNTGLLWGCTQSGGALEHGTIYQFQPSTGAFRTVVEFTGNGATNKGSSPQATLTLDSGGQFWGTTASGGANFQGTIFKLNPSSGVLTTLVEFTGNGGVNKGAIPSSSLTNIGTDLWGSTFAGGVNDLGTIFRLNATTGALVTMAHFTGPNGANPNGSLLRDGTGFLWGTTYSGGAFGQGTIFKVNLSNGALSTVADFQGTGTNARGAHPAAGLVTDGPGFLWGTTERGGSAGFGTVYRVNLASGAISTVLDFSDSGPLNPGTYPMANLLSDGFGTFWGTTTNGGAFGKGTVFTVNASSSLLSNIVQFAGPNGEGAAEGSYPGSGGLVRHSDGNYYGATSGGGLGGVGTIYRIRLGPTPRTLVASNLTSISATLRGTLNPNGQVTQASFEYASNPSMIGATVVPAGTISAGTTAVLVTSPISGLLPGSTYYYRLRGLNSENSQAQLGEILSFGTPTPFAAWAGRFGLSGPASTFKADPDQDGTENLVEHVLGGNPSRYENDTIRVESSLIGGSSVFTFSRADESESTSIKLNVQVGTDLVSWPIVYQIGQDTASSSPGVNVIENGAEPDTISVVLPPHRARQFAQLRVTVDSITPPL